MGRGLPVLLVCPSLPGRGEGWQCVGYGRIGQNTEYALSGAHPVADVSRECHSESEKGFAAAGPPGPLAALVRIMLFPLRAPQGAITLGNVECATHWGHPHVWHGFDLYLEPQCSMVCTPRRLLECAPLVLL